MLNDKIWQNLQKNEASEKNTKDFEHFRFLFYFSACYFFLKYLEAEEEQDEGE